MLERDIEEMKETVLERDIEEMKETEYYESLADGYRNMVNIDEEVEKELNRYIDELKRQNSVFKETLHKISKSVKLDEAIQIAIQALEEMK